MAGSITKEDREFVETWEHISPQRWGVTRLDPRGDERPEIVQGRRTFRLTTEERMITQDKIKKDADDPFRNGAFRPVIVPDSVTIETNPNALSDDEILRILASSDMAWKENLSTIDSVATIRRMLDLAEQADLGMRRYRELENRLEGVRGMVKIDTNDPTLQKFLANKPGALADNTVASGATNPRRSVGGGRSSDYRS